MPTTAKTPEEFAARFWAKVDQSGECWIWQGALTPAGYGNLKHQQKTLFAHRVSYELQHGRLDPRKLVLHSCDNRRCVRPEHLRVGTQSNNMADCSTRGRNRKEGTRAAKLTAEIVREIRQRYDDGEGETQRAIADSLGLSQTGVSHVILRKTWAWVD